MLVDNINIYRHETAVIDTVKDLGLLWTNSFAFGNSGLILRICESHP